MKTDNEIFSYHIVRTDIVTALREMFLPTKFPGLLHSEGLFSMKLGAPITNPSRYGLTEFVFFARWEDEKSLEHFLAKSGMGKTIAQGWHVRLKFYRRWGSISEFSSMPENEENLNPQFPVVGITLARLKISEALRFLKWGKPVEHLVKNHPGKTFAMASMRPIGTLSTFSIWKSERDMVSMVKGNNVHGKAITEQMKRSFHHEFSTMRFYLLGEFGERLRRT